MGGVEGEMRETLERFGRVRVELDLGDQMVVRSGKSGREGGDGFEEGVGALC